MQSLTAASPRPHPRARSRRPARAMADLIHTAELDFYGRQLASAGSDRRIKIFEVVDGVQRQQTAELVGHDGPVWHLAWAHPEFGNVLASCSYDRQVRAHAAHDGALRTPPPPPRTLLRAAATAARASTVR